MMFLQNIHDISVNYHDYGDPSQPTLVLIHGLGCSLKYWQCVFDAPEFSGYRIVALDLPGFGMSAKPDTFDYDLHSQADITAELLRILQVPTYTVIGHSMGGSIAILLARAHPERIQRLVVIEPNLRASDAHLSREIIRQSEADFVAHYETFTQIAVTTVQSWFVNSHRADLEEYIRELLKTTPISIYRSARSLMTVTADEAFLRHFLTLSVPKDFLMGAETLKIRQVPARFAGSDVNTVIVPGVGHMMMVDNPALFNRTLASILL
jgi:pimeloyl-ACP methyl ester carboxylesterase